MSPVILGALIGGALSAASISGEYFGALFTLSVVIVLGVCFLIANLVLYLLNRPARNINPIRPVVYRDVAALYLDVIPGNGLGAFIQPHPNGGDVHDHAIQQSISAGITALQQWAADKTILSPKDTEAQIKKYIFGKGDDVDKKELAYNTLRTMTKVNGRLESVNMTEMEILALVWSRICDPVNAEVQEELKSNLIESMADATIVLDSQYCLTGRVTRVVQAIESIDKEGIVNIRSTESIKAEITLKVGALRTAFFEAHPGYEELYNADQDTEETRRVNVELKDYVREQLYGEYVPLVTEDTFGRIITPLIEAL